MQVPFDDSGTTGSYNFRIDDDKCIEFALEYHEEQLIKIPQTPKQNPALLSVRSRSPNRVAIFDHRSPSVRSKLGFTDGTGSEFNGSIKTAVNAEYT